MKLNKIVIILNSLTKKKKPELSGFT